MPSLKIGVGNSRGNIKIIKRIPNVPYFLSCSMVLVNEDFFKLEFNGKLVIGKLEFNFFRISK